MKPSSYEQTALREIEIWKSPAQGWFGKALELVSLPIDKAGELAMKTPGVGWVLEKSVGGIVSVANDVAQWSVRPDAIYAEYRKAGHAVSSPTDIHRLDLENVDRAIGWLGAKYKGIALTEGAASGAAGLPGIPVDIAALITLNLRGIGEYATYVGFDTSSQHERLFAMNVLGLASSPTDAAKMVAMAQLVKIAQAVATKKTWQVLEQHAFVAVIRQIAKALSIRLTKAKLAQVLPAAGAVVGGGFNAYYTDKVCDAAFYLYRERFLAAKYGPEYVKMSLKEAASYDAGYATEAEGFPEGSTPPPGV